MKPEKNDKKPMIGYLVNPVNPVKKLILIDAIILSIIFMLFGPPKGFADDVGITKARLIQKSEKSYVLEADVTRILVWAIKAPIFPDRFQVSELEYVTQSSWIVVQATATTTGEPMAVPFLIQGRNISSWADNGSAVVVAVACTTIHPARLTYANSDTWNRSGKMGALIAQTSTRVTSVSST